MIEPMKELVKHLVKNMQLADGASKLVVSEATAKAGGGLTYRDALTYVQNNLTPAATIISEIEKILKAKDLELTRENADTILFGAIKQARVDYIAAEKKKNPLVTIVDLQIIDRSLFRVDEVLNYFEKLAKENEELIKNSLPKPKAPMTWAEYDEIQEKEAAEYAAFAARMEIAARANGQGELDDKYIAAHNSSLTWRQHAANASTPALRELAFRNADEAEAFKKETFNGPEKLSYN